MGIVIVVWGAVKTTVVFVASARADGFRGVGLAVVGALTANGVIRVVWLGTTIVVARLARRSSPFKRLPTPVRKLDLIGVTV